MEVYTPPIFKPEDTIDQVYNEFKEEWIKMLNALAPQKTIKTTEKLQQPWFNRHIRQQHKVMNNCYHVWVKYKQAHHWTVYNVKEDTGKQKEHQTIV